MATYYVNSNAAGLNTGASWTDAYTSIASAVAFTNAGDTVKVEYRHSQSGLSSAVNFANGTLIAPVRIVSCDKDNSDAPRVGAVIGFGTTSNIGVSGNVYVYGVTFNQTAASLRHFCPSGGIQVFESCTMSPTGTGTLQFGDGSVARFITRLVNTNIDLSGATSSAFVSVSSAASFEWIGGTTTCKTSQTNLTSLSSVLRMIVTGVTFSGTVTNLIQGGTTVNFGVCRFERCVAPGWTNVFGTNPTVPMGRIELNGFVSGTITAALLPPTQVFDLQGTVKTSLTRYRTGGADDGSQANAYSWEMATDADAAAFTAPLVSPPLTRWVAAGSQTVTVYVASGTTLKDDEVWVEVLSPSEAGSATAAAKFQTTRAAPLATPANVTTDAGSTWTGTGVGTLQKCNVTINPTVAGYVEIRVHLAKASTTVYVDPVPDVAGNVAGKSRFVAGVQTFAASGGGLLLQSGMAGGLRG